MIKSVGACSHSYF